MILAAVYALATVLVLLFFMGAKGHTRKPLTPAFDTLAGRRRVEGLLAAINAEHERLGIPGIAVEGYRLPVVVPVIPARYGDPRRLRFFADPEAQRIYEESLYAAPTPLPSPYEERATARAFRADYLNLPRSSAGLLPDGRREIFYNASTMRDEVVIRTMSGEIVRTVYTPH